MNHSPLQKLKTLRLSAPQDTTQRLPSNSERTQQILWTPPSNPRLIVTTARTRRPFGRDAATISIGVLILIVFVAGLLHLPVSKFAAPKAAIAPPPASVVHAGVSETTTALVTAPVTVSAPLHYPLHTVHGPYRVPPPVPIDFGSPASDF